jgi:hypothetical protein
LIISSSSIFKVLEQDHSLLEDPISLFLREDTPRICNNPVIILKVTHSISSSLPICPGFYISSTTTASVFIGLSTSLQSRFLCILAPKYPRNIPRTISQNIIVENFSRLFESITNNNLHSIGQNCDIYLGFIHNKVKIYIPAYVCGCKTPFHLIQSDCIPLQFEGGVSALRAIVDTLSDEDWHQISKKVL